MPRPTNTDERRAQITRGLLKVMATRGYEGATVQDIARAARLSPGLVHYHFKAKQQVLEALLDSLLGRHLEGLDAALARCAGSGLEPVYAFLDYHLATGATADPEALAVWVSLGAEALKSSTVRTRYARALGALRDRLQALIVQGQAQKVLSPGDAAASAAALLATIEGYFVMAAAARELIPHASAAPSARRMAQGLLLKRSRP